MSDDKVYPIEMPPPEIQTRTDGWVAPNGDLRSVPASIAEAMRSGGQVTTQSLNDVVVDQIRARMAHRTLVLRQSGIAFVEDSLASGVGNYVADDGDDDDHDGEIT